MKKPSKGAGAYTEFLTFNRMPFPEVMDSSGGSISVPEFQFSTWGAFEPIGSDEFPAAEKRHSETTARFRIPYPDYPIDPARHQIVMDFDESVSPPNTSTWNVLGAYGDRFETTIEVSEVK